MRTRALPALAALAWLCMAGAATAQYNCPTIPDRRHLAGGADGPTGVVLPAGYTDDELSNIILSTAAPQLRVEAVRRLTDERKTSGDADYLPHVRTLTYTADRLLAGGGDPAFRRYGVSMLFAQAYSSTDASLPVAFTDGAEWELWRSVEALRATGLKDKDARLRGYFARYVPLKAMPDWRRSAARMHRVTARIIKDKPALQADLERRLAMAESTQGSQLTVLKQVLADLTRREIPPQLREQFIRGAQQEFAYRLNALWTVLYAQNLIEAAGPAAAARYGVSVAEVKLGWPAYSRPEGH